MTVNMSFTEIGIWQNVDKREGNFKDMLCIFDPICFQHHRSYCSIYLLTIRIYTCFPYVRVAAVSPCESSSVNKRDDSSLLEQPPLLTNEQVIVNDYLVFKTERYRDKHFFLSNNKKVNWIVNEATRT
jgi:hypothetical protein